MISVIGATGTVGGKVAAMLLEAGVPVRILVRDVKKASPLQNEGAEVVEGDLDNVSDITNAFDRCDGAFLMSPVNRKSERSVEDELRRGLNLAEALKGSTVKHAVYMSVIAAGEHTGIPHFESKAQIQEAICASGVDCTVLHPAFFMENFYGQWPLIQKMGIISFPFPPDVPLPMVATEDIAYAAVQSLKRGGRGRESFDLLGSKSYTMEEVVKIISEIVGREVRYVQASPEQAVDYMVRNGLSQTSAKDLVMMYEKYAGMEFPWDRNRVYDEFNYEPTPFETVIEAAAGALRAEAT